jgi:hypothetical protein
MPTDVNHETIANISRRCRDLMWFYAYGLSHMQASMNVYSSLFDHYFTTLQSTASGNSEKSRAVSSKPIIPPSKYDCDIDNLIDLQQALHRKVKASRTGLDDEGVKQALRHCPSTTHSLIPSDPGRVLDILNNPDDNFIELNVPTDNSSLRWRLGTKILYTSSDTYIRYAIPTYSYEYHRGLGDIRGLNHAGPVQLWATLWHLCKVFLTHGTNDEQKEKLFRVIMTWYNTLTEIKPPSIVAQRGGSITSIYQGPSLNTVEPSSPLLSSYPFIVGLKHFVYEMSIRDLLPVLPVVFPALINSHQWYGEVQAYDNVIGTPRYRQSLGNPHELRRYLAQCDISTHIVPVFLTHAAQSGTQGIVAQMKTGAYIGPGTATDPVHVHISGV